MVSIFYFFGHVSNNLHKLILYYWYSTEYCKTSQWFKIFTLPYHIYQIQLSMRLSKFLEVYMYEFSEYNSSMKPFIISSTNFGCCFLNCLLYFTMKDKPVWVFLWMMSFCVLLKRFFMIIFFYYHIRILQFSLSETVFVSKT